MGKRELVLILGFVCAGVLVYQFTAPPSAPGERGFSLARLIEGARREIRGNRATARTTHSETHPAPASIQEVRLDIRGELTVTGEDRDDIATELKVTSRAYDDAEAQQTANATRLKFDDAGSSVGISVDFPDPGQQTVALVLRIPKRLKVRIDEKNGPLLLTNAAAVAMGTSRGKTEISGVSGLVALTQRGGSLTIKDVGSLRVNVRGGAEVTVSAVRGDTTLNLQSGELRASDLHGAIEIEASSADVRLEKLQQAAGPVRINATAGTIELSGLVADTRIDGRNTEIRVDVDRPAPLAIYSEGDERVELTFASGAKFTLDASARDAQVTGDGDLLTRWGVRVEDGTTEDRANGPVRGGGPTIVVRTNRGDILLREAAR